MPAPEDIIRLFRDLFEKGEYEQILEKAETLTSSEYSDPEYLIIRGTAAGKCGNYKKAVDDLTEAQNIAPEKFDAYLALGICLINLGDFNKGIYTLREAVKLHPADLKIRQYLGSAYLNSGDQRSAMDEFNYVLGQDGDNPKALLGLGHTFLNNGDFLHAEEVYTKLIEQKVELKEAYFHRGICQNNLGKTVAAISDFDQVILMAPDFADGYNYRGELLFYLQDYVAAKENFKRLTEINTDYPNCFFKLGKCYKILCEYTNAITAFSRDIDYKPDKPESYLLRGSVFALEGQHRQAIQDFNVAELLSPTNYTIFMIRAMSRNSLGDFDGAIIDYKKHIRYNPADAGCYFSLAMCYEESGDINNALLYLSKCLEVDPVFMLALITKSNLHFKRKEFKAAITLLKAAIKINVADSDLHARIGRAYFGLEVFDKALEHFQQSYLLDPNNHILLLEMAQTCGHLKEIETAFQYLKKYQAIDPTDFNAYIISGKLNNRLGNLQDSLKDYTKSIELNPMATVSYMNRSLIYEHLGDYENALTDMDYAITLQPEKAELYNNRATLLMEMGKMVEASNDYLKATELDENFALPWYGLCVLGIKGYLKDGGSNNFRYLIRFIFLVTDSQLTALLPKIVAVSLQFEAPFLTIELLRQLSYFEEKRFNRSLLITQFELTKDLRSLIGKWSINRLYPNQSWTAEAIIHLYCGNPQKSLYIFDREMDTPEIPLKCIDQYYFYQSCHLCIEPYQTSLQHFGLRQALATLKDDSSPVYERYYAALILDLAGSTADALFELDLLAKKGYVPAWYKWMDISARKFLWNPVQWASFIKDISLRNISIQDQSKYMNGVIITGDEDKVLEELLPLVQLMENKDVIALLLQSTYGIQNKPGLFDISHFFIKNIEIQEPQKVKAKNIEEQVEDKNLKAYKLVFGNDKEKNELKYDIINYTNRGNDAYFLLGKEIHPHAFTAYSYRKEHLRGPIIFNHRKYLLLISNLYEKKVLTAKQGHFLHQYIYYCAQKIGEFQPDEILKITIDGIKDFIDTAQFVGIGFSTIESIVRYGFAKLKGKDSPLLSFEMFVDHIDSNTEE